MGFNNGYDSGYSDCEAENRKRWEREAVERYKAENPPSGGGSSGDETWNPVVMLKDCQYIISANDVSGDPDAYTVDFIIDASSLPVGAALFIDGTGSQPPSLPTEDAYYGGGPWFKIKIPAAVTQVFESFGVGDSQTKATPVQIVSDDSGKSFRILVGTAVDSTIRPSGILARTSEDVVYFAATSASTE